MSQPKTRFTEIDFSSVMQDRRVPLPITNLPVNALTDDTDPTREIRALIEQLQQSARDARTQQRAADDERKETVAQLELARRQNDELRAHFVEITSLIRERDSALQDLERQSRTLQEAQSRAAGAEQACQDLHKQCEAAGRQKDELVRHKDELVRQKEELNRRMDAVTHTSQETTRCFNEAQRQILAIRQARDAATALNTDLAQKLSRAEDSIADLQYQSELLEKKAVAAKEQAAQIEALRNERDEARKGAKVTASELESVRAVVAELTAQVGAALEAGKQHETELAAATEQAAVISRERDACKTDLESKARELDQLNLSLSALASEKNEILESSRRHEAALVEARDGTAAIAGDREALRQDLEKKSQEAEEFRKSLLALANEKNEFAESDRRNQAALAEVREQIEAVTAERDALAMELKSNAKELTELRQRPDGATHSAAIENLENEIKALQHERSTEELRVQVLSREVLDLRNQLQVRAEQIESLQRTAQHAGSDLAQAQAQFDTLRHERDVSKRLREEALTSLAAAQKQIDKIIRDRDLIRQQNVENSLALEAQVEALRAQLQVMECSPGAAIGGHADITEMARLLDLRERERRELADRLEQQRAATIDLGAQLHSAQDQIKQLGASLAEARLLAKTSGRHSTALPSPEPVSREPMARDQSGRESIPRATRESSPPRESGPRASIFREFAEPPPLPSVSSEAFGLAESHELVRSMKRCHQAFLKNSADLSHLNELHCHVHCFAERARAGGLVALHRLSAAFSGLAQELYHYPEQVNASALRTVGQTIEFLSTLLRVKDLRQVKDPATAVVYAVDDDAENCDCIRMAMETAMMRTSSSQDPIKAICELAEKPCDLIFLDVNMPGMDGFELCAEIRRLTLHATTPVIFVSGLNSSENRMQSSLSGGNEFVGKPFILCELTVKALTLILKSHLHLA